jgi:GT2 family glycosyltransferase
VLAVAIINYRTAEATRRCASLCASMPGEASPIYLLDNGSGDTELAVLHALAAEFPAIRLIESPINVGFAAGMNLLLTSILADGAIDQVLLLNSDTEPTPNFIAAMQARLDAAARIDMVAAKLLDAKSGNVDTLGITLYRSTLASNRKRDDEKLLGPSGGCALLTRRLLEDLHAQHGEWFDETYFCYAEDTDLAVRARWLGYRAAYAPDAVVRHAGSLSSGGPDNDFVLYHGIRNSLWWLVKNAPLGWFLRSLPWFVALHVGIVLRHVRRGRARVVWRLYRDAIKGIGVMRRKRAIIRRTRRVAVSEFAAWVEPHFYQRDYVRRAWRELFRPGR